MSGLDKPVVLYVDDEAGNLAAFNAAFRRDFDIRLAQSADEAIEALDQEQVDVMITDQRMPTTTGINLVRATKSTHPEVVKMILTGFADHDVVLAALNEGLVYRFFESPGSFHHRCRGSWRLRIAERLSQRKDQLLEMRDNLQRGVDSVDELLGHLSVQKDDLDWGSPRSSRTSLAGCDGVSLDRNFFRQQADEVGLGVFSKRTFGMKPR